jgi:hypothetical protein
MFDKKIKCVSCNKNKPTKEIRYTFRNRERLALCSECWDAAKYVLAALSPVNKADEARNRWLHSQQGIK